jgi:hypothetical protein
MLEDDGTSVCFSSGPSLSHSFLPGFLECDGMKDSFSWKMRILKLQKPVLSIHAWSTYYVKVFYIKLYRSIFGNYILRTELSLRWAKNFIVKGV